MDSKLNWIGIGCTQEAWGNRWMYRISKENIPEFSFTVPAGPCKGTPFYGYQIKTGRGVEIRSLKLEATNVDGSIDVSEFESIGD